MQIISLILHHNETRNTIVNQPSFNKNSNPLQSINQDEELQTIFEIIVVTLNLAITLKNLIEKYLEKADTVFIKTGDYIKLLDIATPIQAARNQDGKIIFDEIKQ